MFADEICDHRKFGFNTFGNRIAGGISEFWKSTVYQYKNNRVSLKEFKRTDTLTGEEKIFNEIPNYKCPTHGEWCNLIEQDVVFNDRETNKFQCPIDGLFYYETGEYMSVPTWLKARKKSKKHWIYGTVSQEYWFNGRMDMSTACCDILWPEIEARGHAVRADNQMWPHHNTRNQNELKTILCVPCNDFDETVKAALIKPVFDLTNPKKPIIIKKRECYCDIENDIVPLLGGTASQKQALIDDIKNPKISVDIRKLKDPFALWDIRTTPDFVRANIVKVKV